MEVFLDAVAAFASSDAPWLLDERFDGLLSASDRNVVTQARQLATQAEGGSGLLEPLRQVLRALGGH
ncbi:hypothetical protein G3I15_48590 [Streptomyces sp. SID10244]|nr:hypothetical protein [Streptomyces sp. SID10244]